jgi:hypothetical protein
VRRVGHRRVLAGEGEANPINLAAHIRAPKRLVVYEGGHVPPAGLMLRSIDPRLDEMLGRVRRE